MSAEEAYLFRHAVMREVAYQLMLPLDRAVLHALALELLEAADAPPAELAHHARNAQSDPAREAEMQARELLHLRAAAGRAQDDWRPVEAIALARRAAELPCAPPRVRAGARSMIVSAALTLGDYALAKRELGVALELCRAEGGDEFLPDVLFNAGLASYITRDLDAAREYNSELLELEACRAEPARHARALKQRGVVLKEQRQFEEAAATFANALGLARKHAEPREVAGVLLDRGICLVQAGELDEAARDFDEALKLLRGQRDPLRLSILLRNSSDLRMRQGDLRGALEAAEQATAVARAALLPVLTTEALRQTAGVLAALGRKAEAAGASAEAERIRSESGV